MKSLLLPLLLLAAVSPAVESKNIFNWIGDEFNHIFHSHASHEIGNWWHGFASKFEHDLEKIGHALEQVPEEVNDELHHLEQAFGPVWHDIEAATKHIVTFVRNFQPWLVQINSEVFGPTMGPLLEKLEVAVLERIPIVGEAVALVVDGVNVYDDVVAAKHCWDKHDLDCVGEQIANALLKVSSTMEEDFKAMAKIAKALEGLGKLVEAGVTLNDAIKTELPLIKQGIDEIHAGGASNILHGLADLGRGVDGIIQHVEHAVPATTTRWQAAASALQRAARVVDNGDRIFAAGASIADDVRALIACYHQSPKNWTCVGQQLSNIGVAIEQAAPKNAALERFAKVLTGIPADIAFAQDIVQTYHLFDQCFDEISHAHSEADWRRAVQDLGAALDSIAVDITALNAAVGANIPAKMQQLEDMVSLIVAQASRIDNEVGQHGFAIYDDLRKMATEWSAHRYEDLARTLEDLMRQVAAVAADYPKLHSVVQALNAAIRIDDDGIQLYDIFSAAWPLLQKALTELEAGNLRGIAQGYIDLSDFVSQVADKASAVDPAIAAKVRQLAQYLKTEIVIAKDLRQVFVAGLDVQPLVQHAVQCFRSHDWACVGQQIGQMIQDLQADLPDWRITRDIIAGLNEVENGFRLAGDADHTVELLDQALALLKGGDAAGVQQGLEKLGEAIGSLTAELEDVDRLTYQRYHSLVEALEHDVTVAQDKEQAAIKYIVDGVDIYSDVHELMSCYQKKDWLCVGREIKALKDIIKALVPNSAISPLFRSWGFGGAAADSTFVAAGAALPDGIGFI